MAKKRPSASEKSMQDVALDGYRWTDVRNPTFASLDVLKRRHSFLHDTDLRDCLPPYQRPKLIERDGYLFAVLLFPVYDRQSGVIRSSEITFFIGPDFAVTSHASELRAVTDAASRASRETAFRVDKLNGSPARLLDTLLRDLLSGCFPMLAHVSTDIDAVEAAIFKDADEATVREVLRIKTNIANFRKIMQGHAVVLRKLLDRGPRLFDASVLSASYRDLSDHINEIWDALGSYKDSIDALHESQVSLVSFQTSRTTKHLTAIALVIFPTTLVATIFSMRAENIPFMGNPNDFWIMIGLLLTVMTGTAAAMKRKNLL